MSTIFGYSDGSTSRDPEVGGWSFIISPSSPEAEFNESGIICIGDGGRQGMKLGEAEVSPLMFGLLHLRRMVTCTPRCLRNCTSIVWVVDAEFVALVWCGTYKVRSYPEHWASIRQSEKELEKANIQVTVVHRHRNTCPGQSMVDDRAGKNRLRVIDTKLDFADMTWRIIRQ